MLIDQVLPHYDVRARYQIDIHAPVDKAYRAARSLDMRESGIVRWLHRMRGLPEYGLTINGMLKLGFVLLADKPSQEIVFGLIGRFWKLSGGIRSVDAGDFLRFKRPGFAKVAGNIAFVSQADGTVRAITETRVLCLDEYSRRRFRLYWLLISPFSGMVRKEWLRLIKRRAEGDASKSRLEYRSSLV